MNVRTLGIGAALLIVGCGSAGSEPIPESASGAATEDVCGPNRAPRAEQDPNATCALKTEDYEMGPNDETPDEAGSEGAGEVRAQTSRLSLASQTGSLLPSCKGRTGPGFTTCGTAGTGNCCGANTVPTGTAGTIHIKTAFDLGVYEVTSGRFQAFVTAFNGNIRNAALTNKLPGFDKAWAPHLPASRGAVDSEMGVACKARSNVADFGARTWPTPDIPITVASFITDDNAIAADIRADATPARLSAKPINCVSYWMAAAFCAWDGGRLPTNAEWAFAALGGAENRIWPWGNQPQGKARLVTALTPQKNVFTFPENVSFTDNGFNAYHIAPPGRKPGGAGRWGHMDLGGNVLEWVANTVPGDKGFVRGGSWEGHDAQNKHMHTNYPLDRTYGSLGFRCAY